MDLAQTQFKKKQRVPAKYHLQDDGLEDWLKPSKGKGDGVVHKVLSPESDGPIVEGSVQKKTKTKSV